MTHRLVDYKKLSHELAAQLIETYPDGYGDEDIIVFKNACGEYVEAVEIRTNDTVYLVKISKSLATFISNFEDNMEKQLEDKSEPVLEEVDTMEMDLDLTDGEIEDEVDYD